MRYALLAVPLLAACGDNHDTPVEGDVYQYTVGALHLAYNNTTARQYSLDLNGDATHDNQLGQVFATLESQGFALSETAGNAVLRGEAIMLVELQTTSFTDAEHVAAQTFVGAAPVPAACTDPTNLLTCGQQLQTRAHYDVVDDGASDAGRGAFKHGVFEAELGDVPIALGLGDDTPIRVTLHGARIRLTDAAANNGSVVIGGGFTAEDVRDVMAPAAARQMTRIITAECHVPGASSPCGCIGGGRADFLDDLFDADHDCSITGAEIMANYVVKSLLTPDVTLGGKQLLSYGFGADLVPAEF